MMIAIPLDLLDDVREAVEESECQFWACEGPTLTPIHMVTCRRCAHLASLRAFYHEPVLRPWETRLWQEAWRIQREALDSHRRISFDEALQLAADYV